MGQIQSKRHSSQSQAPLVVNPSSQTTNYHDFANPTLNLRPEDASITLPTPPVVLNRISALIDPQDFLPEVSAEDSSYTSLTSDPYLPASPHASHNTYRLFPSHSSSHGYNDTRRRSITETIANTIANRRPSLNNVLINHRIKRSRMVVESPTGRTLDHREFLEDPNRPLTIRERQERIRMGLEKANAEAASETSSHKRHLSKSSLIRSSKSKLNLNGNSKSKLSLNGLSTSTTDSRRTEPNGIINEAPGRGFGTFEEKRIEEGKREWEAKQEKKRRGCKIHRLCW